MSDDFDDDGVQPPKDESLNFFAELERLATEDPFEPFAVILMSGDRLQVEAFGQLTTYRTMYFFHARPDGSVMFPFPNVCAVETSSRIT